MQIFAVEGDVFVGIAAVIDGRNEPLGCDVGAAVGIMIALQADVERDITQLGIVQAFSQLEFVGFDGTGISHFVHAWV